MSGGIAVFLVGFLALAQLPTVLAAGIILSPPKFEFRANPGDTIRGVVKLTNQNENAISMSSSVGDFMAKNESGSPAFVARGDEAVDTAFSLSSWIHVNDGKAIDIGANGKADVPFSIDIPANAEPGGHYGVIFFEPPAGGGQIGVTQRLGALVLVQVSGEITESGRLDTFGAYPTDVPGEDIPQYSSQFSFENAPIPFAIRYENTGNVHIKPEGRIEIFNTFGQKVRSVGVVSILNELGVEVQKEIVDFIPANNDNGNVLAKSFRTFRAKFAGTPFWYRRDDGVKEIRYGGFPVGLYTAQLTMQGIGDGDTVTAAARFIIFPWKIVGGVTAILLMLFFGGRRFFAWRSAKLEADFKRKFGVK